MADQFQIIISSSDALSKMSPSSNSVYSSVFTCNVIKHAIIRTLKMDYRNPYPLLQFEFFALFATYSDSYTRFVALPYSWHTKSTPVNTFAINVW